MKKLCAAGIAACLLSLPVVGHEVEAVPRPVPQEPPQLAFRPAPVPAQVNAAAESLAQACRLWPPVPFPLASSGIEPSQISDVSMAMAGLCNIAEDPADLEAGAHRALWFGAALGVFGLWMAQLVYRLIRASVALVRRRFALTVS